MHVCTTCGYTFRDNETNPLEHQHTFASVYSFDENTHWFAATCGHDVRKDEEAHKFVDRVVEPTYESQGYTKHTCSVCGYGYVDNYVEPLVPVVTREMKFVTSEIGSNVSSQYTTGNYGSFTANGINFEYYRGIGTGNGTDYITLLDSNYLYGDGGLGDYIFNISPIYDIRELVITYKATESALVTYSTNRYEDENSGTIALEASRDYVTKTVSLPKDTNFVRISTNGSNLYIKEFAYNYTGVLNDYELTSGYQASRSKAPAVVNNLVDGVSKKSFTLADGSVKEYTYYSTEYVVEHQEVSAREASYVTPVDVANYYLAFRCFPANYVYKSYMSNDVTNTFGSYLRQVSSYNRTDGYATAVPYNDHEGMTAPIYHELDIDLDGSYRTNSRGVGRIIVWEDGFSCYEGYDPVIIYTDDHYATFQEYNNNGSFLPRFGAEMVVNGLVHTQAETLQEYVMYKVNYIVNGVSDEFNYFYEGRYLTSDYLKYVYTPYVEGYEFVGWYFDAECTNIVDNYYLYQDVDVYAKFIQSQHMGRDLDDAFTTEEAINHIDAVGDDGYPYYVRGVVTAVNGTGYNGHSYRFVLDDVFTAYYAESYGMIAPKVGDEVIVRGQLTLYNGSIYETVTNTGIIAQNITNKETAKFYYVEGLPFNILSYSPTIIFYTAGHPDGFEMSLNYDAISEIGYFWSIDTLDYFIITLRNENDQVVQISSPTYNYLDDDDNVLHFAGFPGYGAIALINPSEDWQEQVEQGDYSQCYYIPLESYGEGTYGGFIRLAAGVTIAGVNQNVVLEPIYETDRIGEYNLYAYQSTNTFVAEWNNPYDEIEYYFDNLSHTRDANIESYLEDEDNGVLYNTLWGDFALTCFGLDFDDFNAYILENGYVRVEGINYEVYINVENNMAIYFSRNEGLIEVSTIPYAENLYGFTIEGFEEETTTYSINVVDDTKEYYVWAWMQHQNGSWYETNLVDGQLQFEVPMSMNYFCVAEFEAGTLEPNWDYCIRETNNMYLNPRTTVYEIHF